MNVCFCFRPLNCEVIYYAALDNQYRKGSWLTGLEEEIWISDHHLSMKLSIRSWDQPHPVPPQLEVLSPPSPEIFWRSAKQKCPQFVGSRFQFLCSAEVSYHFSICFHFSRNVTDIARLLPTPLVFSWSLLIYIIVLIYCHLVGCGERAE